jgi:3-deoxy-D-arabino-heptulosonate 7-phosphate (DAHP) synthase
MGRAAGIAGADWGVESPRKTARAMGSIRDDRRSRSPQPTKGMKMRKIRITQIIESEIEVDEDFSTDEAEYMADLFRRDYTFDIVGKRHLQEQDLRVEQVVAGLDVKIV